MTNLKWETALQIINGAIAKGAEIYLPREGEVLTSKEWLVGEVNWEGEVRCPKANGGFGFTYYIANDYRLDSMYIQAKHFLMAQKEVA